MARSIQRSPSIPAHSATRAVRGADTAGRPAAAPTRPPAPLDGGDVREPSVAELLRCIERPDEDLLGLDAFNALEAIAADAVEDLLAAFAANRGNLVVRRRLSELLAYAGVRDDRIRAALLEVLVEDPVAGAARLGAYGDRTVVPELLSAFDDTTLDDPAPTPASALESPGEPHEDAYMIASAVSWLGGRLSAAQHAKLDEVIRRRDAAFAAFMKAIPPPPLAALGERQARNSHCRCGSGKKYKKCHLAADVEEALQASS